jgi:RNA recognition motif-containing protein
MNFFLLRNLPDEIRKADLENAFSRFGSVEYVRIQFRSHSGRVAVIKMAGAGGERLEIRERPGHEYKERRLRLVKPRPKETKRDVIARHVSKDGKVNSITSAIEKFFRALRILNPLPEKVRVKR